MATYVREALQRTRAQVRWNYSRANIWPGPGPPQPMPEIPEATLAALKRSLRIEPRPVPETPTPMPPTIEGPAQAFTGAVTMGVAPFCLSWATSQTPYMISEISLTAAVDLTPAMPVILGVSLHVTPDDRSGVLAVPAESPVFPSRFSAVSLIPYALELPLTGSNSITFSPRTPVDRPADYLTACFQNSAIGTLDCSITIVTQQMSVERLIIRPLIIAPQVLTRSLTAAPLPAGRPASTPRGLKISVMVANRPIYSRDIAWASADLELKKQFLNAQLSGVYPPTLQPIW
jgi:hypothetical protein